jgi:general secretion pathway protein L
MAGRLALVSAPLERLFRWWIGELAALVPARLRERLAATGNTLVVFLGADDAKLCLQTRQETKVLGRIDLRADREPQQALTAILRRHGLARDVAAGRASACLRLPADRALRTAIELPLAADGNLDEVVSFELDRHTPFRSERAAFSYRILERDVAGQRLRLALTVVPRPVIDEALGLAARLRLEVDRIDVADGSGAAGSGNLLRSRTPISGTRSYDRTLVRVLSATALVLALIALYLPVYKEQRTAAALEQKFEAVKKSAAMAAALQKEIDALRKDDLFLVDRKRNRPTVSNLLAETTRILPDNAWLSEWQLASGEMQITGYAGSASSLIELLEKSRTFHNTTFQSPVVQDSRTGRERFHISTQVAGTESAGSDAQ